jgi:hypothetical protein
MESDNEIDRGGGGMLGNNDDEYVSDGGEVEREEVEHDDTGPQSPASGPASPKVFIECNLVRVIVLSATFNDISVISSR